MNEPARVETRGRPPLPDSERLKRRNVMLSDADVALALDIGGGNISVGIRVALRVYVAPEPIIQRGNTRV